MSDWVPTPQDAEDLPWMRPGDVSMGVWIGPELYLHQMNATQAAMLGDDAIHRRFDDLFPEEEFTEMVGAMHRVYETGEPEVLQVAVGIVVMQKVIRPYGSGVLRTFQALVAIPPRRAAAWKHRLG